MVHSGRYRVGLAVWAQVDGPMMVGAEV
jgi:hypothetical protein